MKIAAPQPKWRVECPVGAKAYEGKNFVTLDEAAEAHSFTIRSPRGAAVFHHRNFAAALQIARSMAGIDELLARAARLERRTNFLTPIGRIGW